MDSGLAASRRPGMTLCFGHAEQQNLIHLSNSPTQMRVTAPACILFFSRQ
jgi:hypothetical protein